MIEDRFLYREDELSDVVRMWGELLDEGAACSSIVKGQLLSTPLAFGISAFVDDGFADQIQPDPELHLGRGLFELWREGRSRMFGESALAKANAGGGVNCVVLASGWAHVDSENRALAAMKLAEGFMEAHIGLNMRSFAHQVYGEMPFPPEALNLRTMMIPGSEKIPRGLPSALVRLRRDERTFENFITAQLFVGARRPRILFDGRCRAVLRLALDGVSDEQIAADVGITMNGVKKRWQQIFNRVRDANLDELPLNETQKREGKRGTELRHYVIEYVRRNREELHPYDPRVPAALTENVYSALRRADA